MEFEEWKMSRNWDTVLTQKSAASEKSRLRTPSRATLFPYFEKSANRDLPKGAESCPLLSNNLIFTCPPGWPKVSKMTQKVTLLASPGA